LAGAWDLGNVAAVWCVDAGGRVRCVGASSVGFYYFNFNFNLSVQSLASYLFVWFSNVWLFSSILEILFHCFFFSSLSFVLCLL
jgi:hypothetical protein